MVTMIGLGFKQDPSGGYKSSSESSDSLSHRNLIQTIRVCERPIQIIFGGPNRKTLFIAEREAVYCLSVH